MKYIVSLVDKESHLARLNEAAKALYVQALLIQQEALCRLEETEPLEKIVRSSAELHERLLTMIGGIALQYSKPIPFEISADNCVDLSLIAHAMEQGKSDIQATGNTAHDLLTGKQRDEGQLAEFYLGHILNDGDLDELAVAIKAFISEVESVYTEQVTEFIEHVSKTGKFTARLEGSKDMDGEVTVGFF